MDKKRNVYWKIILGLTLFMVAGNLLAAIPTFCDWYRRNLYGFIADGLGRLTSVFPFALGEILMYIGMALVLVTAVLAVLLLFLKKKEKFCIFTKRYMKSMLAVVVGMLTIYTFCWVIPFRCTRIDPTGGSGRTYEVGEMQILRNHIVVKLNEAAKAVLRDENDQVNYGGDLDKRITAAMHNQASRFPELKGYYPPFKEALCYDFLNWMNIGGYTYPYTMEATCGRYISKLYFPVLYAHEMAHHKGYYQENEGVFLAFLACAESGDDLLTYAAYYDMYYYVDDAYWESLCAVLDKDAAAEVYKTQPKVIQQVWDDAAYAWGKVQEIYDEEEHFAEELAPVVEDVAEVGWNTQEEILGEYNYDGVVLLLLKYYDGVLY